MEKVKRDIVLEALENAGEYFDQRADAEYFTDSPGPVGNEEMTRLAEIKEAIAAWNTRPREQALEALLRNCADALDCLNSSNIEGSELHGETEELIAEIAAAINGGGNG